MASTRPRSAAPSVRSRKLQPWQIASLRAFVGGVVMAGSAFFGQLATSASVHTAEIAAGVAFFGYLALRGVVEGWIDQAAVTPAPPAVVK